MSTPVTIAAMADIHFHHNEDNGYGDVFAEISEKADVLVLAGDLTGQGSIDEAKALAKALQGVSIPVVGVLGNHDCENDTVDELSKVLGNAMHILNEMPEEIEGIGFAGIKGFGGGFGKHMLAPFGEQAVKLFAYEAVKEVLSLEKALAAIPAERKVVVMHYAPIVDTVEGEPPEIHPYLGSSRFEEPIDNFGVTAVFHGHAHHGSHRGKTKTGVPVYNVAVPVMQKISEKPYFLLTV